MASNSTQAQSTVFVLILEIDGWEDTGQKILGVFASPSSADMACEQELVKIGIALAEQDLFEARAEVWWQANPQPSRGDPDYAVWSKAQTAWQTADAAQFGETDEDAVNSSVFVVEAPFHE